MLPCLQCSNDVQEPASKKKLQWAPAGTDAAHSSCIVGTAFCKHSFKCLAMCLPVALHLVRSRFGMTQPATGALFQLLILKSSSVALCTKLSKSDVLAWHVGQSYTDILPLYHKRCTACFGGSASLYPACCSAFVCITVALNLQACVTSVQPLTVSNVSQRYCSEVSQPVSASALTIGGYFPISVWLSSSI